MNRSENTWSTDEIVNPNFFHWLEKNETVPFRKKNVHFKLLKWQKLTHNFLPLCDIISTGLFDASEATSISSNVPFGTDEGLFHKILQIELQNSFQVFLWQ